MSILSSAYKFYRYNIKKNGKYQRHWDFDILNAYAKHKKQVKFIQIGSNDGNFGDPISVYIRNGEWTGILVEPVPYLYNRLKENYKEYQDKLSFENSAIASENGKLKFYRLKETDLPDMPVWYDQIGSFNKDVVLKHREAIPNFDELFIEDSVNAITFKDLLNKYEINLIDFLHIDTEGYDFEIIKMIPFGSISIDFIMFEHKHLPFSEFIKAAIFLEKNGYIVRKLSNTDTVAIKQNILRQIK